VERELMEELKQLELTEQDLKNEFEKAHEDKVRLDEIEQDYWISLN
jgi:Tfp pilus assembly protein PilO